MPQLLRAVWLGDDLEKHEAAVILEACGCETGGGEGGFAEGFNGVGIELVCVSILRCRLGGWGWGGVGWGGAFSIFMVIVSFFRNERV